MCCDVIEWKCLCFLNAYIKFEFLVRAPLWNMLPYQAMAMDYAVTSSFQRHPGNTVNMNVNMNMNMNMNPAFTHSWFMPTDLCVPFKPSQTILEPGHVYFINLFVGSITSWGWDSNEICVLVYWYHYFLQIRFLWIDFNQRKKYMAAEDLT